ncbi:MAG: hypothetical protein M3020_17020 [Myxococcota bacterium]|nr:hypothetical protein [Myxococcota bacterium]
MVNLADRVVEVHREPASAGYRRVTVVPQSGRLRLLAFAEIELAVDDFVR